VSGPTSSTKDKAKTISASVEAELKGIPPDDQSQAPTPVDERNAFEIAKLDAEVEQLREKVNDMRSDRSLRERYANLAFLYLAFYTGFCVIIVIAQRRPDVAFKLSNEVIITLVGSTAVAAIGLVGWIARGLFKAPGS
jgi:hypothetical protein